MEWLCIVFIVLVFVVGVFICFLCVWGMNFFVLGDEMVKGLGENVFCMCMIFVFGVVIFVGVVIVIVGFIGFVGLIILYVCCMFVGIDYCWLLLFLVIVGVVLLIVSDIVGWVIVLLFEEI